MALKRTPLYDLHARLGARLVDFAAFEMPVLYTSVLEEHAAVRERVGLFDVSHMSNVWVTGPDAIETLSRTFVCDAAKIPVGGSKYTCMLRDDGTITDDLYVFRLADETFHVVPNAGQNEVAVQRLRELGRAPVDDATTRMCILALQGPRALQTLERYAGRSFDDVKRFHVAPTPEWGEGAFVSRTGYTGEDGVEIFCSNEAAPRVFEGLLKAGEEFGIRPCGLGARDTLRLEKAYCLAGNEFAGGHTPLEAGLGWLVQWDHEFAGKPALVKQKSEGPRVKLAALKLEEKGIPRHGNPVVLDGREVGVVTSGTLSPGLKVGIALAYVDAPLAAPDTALAVSIRDKPVAARVVKAPFI